VPFDASKDAGVAFLKKMTPTYSRIVSACCVLHNFYEIQKEKFLEGETAAEEEGSVHDDLGHAQQQHDIRNALCSYFTTM